LIYVHKERELSDVAARYPADHYILVDDKLRILAAVKKAWGSRVTTVFVQQGHYARDKKMLTAQPAGRREHRQDRRSVGLQTRGFETHSRQPHSQHPLMLSLHLVNRSEGSTAGFGK
jgi:hypothetical protein